MNLNNKKGVGGLEMGLSALKFAPKTYWGITRVLPAYNIFITKKYTTIPLLYHTKFIFFLKKEEARNYPSNTLAK